MAYLEAIYLLSTIVTVVAGLVLVYMGLQAYATTRRGQMIQVAAGFGLIVLAAFGTAVYGFATDFSSARQLLALNSGLSTSGYLLILYSLVSY